MIFYKGTLKSFLGDKFKPGIVTTDYSTAINWMRRLRSRNACLVQIDYKGKLEDFSTNKSFDGVNHWLHNKPTKAKINSLCKYELISLDKK